MSRIQSVALSAQPLAARSIRRKLAKVAGPSTAREIASTVAAVAR